MFIDPATLADNLPRIEEIEKASVRLVTQAVVEFRDQAADIYAHETDKPADIGEDISRVRLWIAWVSHESISDSSAKSIIRKLGTYFIQSAH